MELVDVLISPVVTEKSSKAQSNRKYTFLVHQHATKIDVKRAVEDAYGVKVDSINIIYINAKVRLAGRGKKITKRQDAKKAIVTLKSKQVLDFNKVKISK